MIGKRLSAALSGRTFWLKLTRKYYAENGIFVLLMPEDDRELNELALLHIGDLLTYRKASGVVILTDKTWIIENAETYSKQIIAVEKISKKEIDNLLSFYELYAFTERLCVVSLTKPFGSKLHNALGAEGVTKEDIVCLSIFLIRDWTNSEGESG
jgi:hypothetical protein